jgi:hypothetical protein
MLSFGNQQRILGETIPWQIIKKPGTIYYNIS